MPHEVIADVAVGILELGAEAATSSNKKNGMGCLLLTIILVLISVGIYFSDTEVKEEKGLITKKLPNDKMVIRTEKGEDVHKINHELYLNKQEGDSIVLNK
jgi:hypothetical protein